MKKIVTALLLLSGLSAKAQTVSTYNYTGAVQSYTVPVSGIVTINCKGAKGANGTPGHGGAVAGTGALGGTVEGTYPVAGGQVLYIWVGGAASGSTGGVNGGGSGNNSSGGGGGASDIRLGDVALSSRIMVAGGGGGGGNGGSLASNLSGGNGGVGGGGAGTNGANSIGGDGGAGASGATGGSQGGGCSFALGTSGGNGVAGQGGAGGVGLALYPATIYSSGGGGGGGYSGGGGGGAGSAGTYSCTLNETGAGGGGAGGTNYIGSGFTSTTNTQGTGPSGNGSVVITFTAVDPITGTLAVCAGSTTSLSNATTGGTWSSSDIAKATINSSGVVSGVAAGTATISYVLPGGATATEVVTVNPLPVGSTTINNVLCNGGNTGSINLTVTGGATPYTYSWNGGATTEDRTALVAGAYSVIITDAKGCKDTVSETLTQPSALSTVGSYTATSCNGGSNGRASVSVSGGTPAYFYSWAPSGGTAALATGLSANNYTVTVTDNNACVTTQTVTVTQPTALSAVGSYTNVACNGGSTGRASVSVSGGTPSYFYSWAPSGGTGATATGLTAGNYTVTFTDNNSCTGTQTVTVTQPAAINTSTTVVTVACNGGSSGMAAVNASGGAGGFTYSWSPGGASTNLATGLNAGIYTVTVTDANGCTATRNATVTQPSAIFTSTAVTTVACNGGSNGVASITASGGVGGYTYSWAPGGATTSAITGLTAGAYTATVTDANSCTSTKTATVTQPSAIMTSTAVTTVACNGGSNGVASITASGGAGSYTYSWAPGGATTSAITGLTAGAYTATVTDANACTQTQTVTVTEPTAIVANISSITNVACNGGTNGAATISASGGTPSYIYSWAPSGGTAATASGLAAGNYTCTVTDANACTQTQTVTVTQPTAVSISSITSNGPVCSGATLSLSGTASGGVGSFTYSWDGPNSFSSIAQDPSITSVTTDATGIYTFTATDANSCPATGTVSVTVNPSPDAGTITGTASVCETSITTLSNAAAGTGAWTIDATGTATIDGSGVVSGIAAGTATVTYTATTVCGTATTTQVVTVNPLPDAGTITGTASVCESSATTLTDASAGGVWTSDALSIATVDGMGVVSGVSAGTATISYVVINGCGVATTMQIVTVNPLPYAGSIAGAANVCMSIPATLSESVSGGTWATGAAGIATINSAGVVSGVSGGTAMISYSVTNGCGTDIATHVVTVVPLPTAGTIAGTTSVCPGNTTSLSNTAIGGVWSAGASTIATINSGGVVTGVAAGTATITYTVSNICGTAIATKIVTVNALADAGTITGAASVCEKSTITLSDAMSGGVWSMSVAGIAHVTSSGLVVGISAGTATITYTVINACGTDFTTKTVTVNPLPIVGSISGTASLNVGSTTTLSNPTTGGTWTIGAATVATVNASGVVTGVSAGTVVISYTVTNGNGCSASATTIVTVNPVTLGSIAAAANVNISLYPNPTTGAFAVSTPEAGNLSIYTLEGREVMSAAVSAGTTSLSLPSTMATGIYMCRFTGNNGALMTIRMVYEH